MNVFSIIRLIKYKLAKRQYKRDHTSNDLTDIQSNVISIYMRLLSRYDSEMVVAPLSGKKYLKWRDIKAILRHGTIIIINHKYYYSVQVPNYYIDKLTYKFDCKLERRRIKMEKQMDNDVNSSLTDILNGIQSDIMKFTSNR